MIGDLYIHNLTKIQEVVELEEEDEDTPVHYKTINMQHTDRKTTFYYYIHREKVRIYYNDITNGSGVNNHTNNTTNGNNGNNRPNLCTKRNTRKARLLLKSYEVFPKFDESGYEPTIVLSRSKKQRNSGNSVNSGSCSGSGVDGDQEYNRLAHKYDTVDTGNTADNEYVDHESESESVVELDENGQCDIDIVFKLSVDAKYNLLDGTVDMNRVIICAFEIIQESTPLAYTQTVFYAGLQIMGKFITTAIESGDGYANEFQMHDVGGVGGSGGVVSNENDNTYNTTDIDTSTATANGLVPHHPNPNNPNPNAVVLSSEAVKFLPRDLVTYFDNTEVSTVLLC